MHYRCLAVLLLATLAAGQAPSASTSKASSKPAISPAVEAKPAGAEAVPADAAVITIEGMCDAPASKTKAATPAKKADCKTVVTRAEFDALANALQPNMNAATKRKLADVYPKMLMMAHAAQQRGLQNDPKFKQVLQFARLQILSQELSRSVKEQADKVPAADIEKYYKENTSAFEQASLQRLFIPKDKQAEGSGNDDAENKDTGKADTAKNADKPADAAKAAATQKADEEAMKKEADALQARAKAGEDFDKLQKEAYEQAGLKGTPPATNMGKLTRAEVPVTHRAALDLKAGEVSQVFSETNGFYIYKVVSKEVKTLDQAKDEIRASLAQQRLQDAMEKIQQSGTPHLNEAYFAAPPAPQMGMPGLSPSGRPAPGTILPGGHTMPMAQPGAQATPPAGQSAPPAAKPDTNTPDSAAPKN